MAGYSGTPLLKKLGLKSDARAVMLHIPADVKPLFVEHQDFAPTLTGEFDYIHIFVTDQKTLETEIAKAKVHLTSTGMLWVSWPKAGKLGTQLNENIIREIGLDTGLVDIKVAAIDETWSGLKFVFRVKDRK